jgi:hypothetical protein
MLVEVVEEVRWVRWLGLSLLHGLPPVMHRQDRTGAGLGGRSTTPAGRALPLYRLLLRLSRR